MAGVYALVGLCSTSATERYFTYTYEPETMPKGLLEYEQWVTLRAGRSKAVGQDNYNRWDLRHELEYGATDNYTVALYLNEHAESFKEPLTGESHNEFHFDGISLENRYMVLNPAERAVGLALYLEGGYAGDEAFLEQRIILGQRHGDWKWALNLTHETEWEDHLNETEGELEMSLGLTRQLGRHWSAGIEARDHNELPEYRDWENTALYAGPVVTYRQEKWWATLTVMPQVFGTTFSGSDPDGNSWLELEGHERWNIRLIVGISF